MSSLQFLNTDLIINSVALALLHFLWQGTLIALILLLILSIWQHNSTRTRYVASVVALVMMLLVPVATAFIIASRTTQNPVSQPSFSISPAPTAPVLRTSDMQTNAATDPVITTAFAFPLTWNTPKALPWIIAAWLLGVLAFSIRLTGSWLFTRRLKRFGKPLIDARLDAVVLDFATRLRVTRAVRLLESGLVQVPTAIGWLRPVILLPAAVLTGISPKQLEAIIAHELAHISRYDYLVNFLQAAIESLLFYHPAVWWVSRTVRQEREMCCDDLAVAVCGDRIVYARALLEIEAMRTAPGHLVMAVNGGSLMHRIQRIVRTESRHRDRFAGCFAGIVVVLLVISVCAAGEILRLDQSRGIAPASRPLALPYWSRPIPLPRPSKFFPSKVRSTPASVLSSTESGTTGSVKASPQLVQQKATSDAVAIAESLKALSSSSPVERSAGACSLGRFGAIEAIPALIALLGDDAAAPPINCWSSGDWSPAMDTLKHQSPGEQAAIALASLGQNAVDPLVSALSSSNPVVRRNAAWAIGEVRGGLGTDRTSAIEPLIVALGDGDPLIRMAAAFSLGEMRPRAAVNPLIASVADTVSSVREMSIRALGEIKARDAISSLTNALLRDEHEGVRCQAAWALGEIRDQAALEALTAALNDQDRDVRAKVKWAIAEIRD